MLLRNYLRVDLQIRNYIMNHNPPVNNVFN
jgi:hypothetical protein